jgi:hypothetical protein
MKKKSKADGFNFEHERSFSMSRSMCGFSFVCKILPEFTKGNHIRIDRSEVGDEATDVQITNAHHQET